MRILIVSREYPPASVGGISRRLSNLVPRVLKMGIDVDVVCFGGSSLAGERVFSLDPKSPISYARSRRLSIYDGTRVLTDVWNLDRYASMILSSGRYDLVQVEEPVFGPFISSSVPKVVTTHVTQLGEVGALLEVFNSSGQISRLVFSGTIGWAFDRLCLRDADVVVAVGPVIRTELCRYYGVREEIVRVIPNGVDVPRKVNKVEAKREIGVDNILFLYVGRLVDRKRVGDFLAALHMVRQRGLEDFSALIVGSGPVGHALTRLTSGLRLGDRVTFTGHVDDRMLFHLFEAADVFVLPSCYEGNPISVMEAMAYGCVPVVSDIPHLREIVRTHENGLTYPVGDVESLADALLTLATDDELRASISLAARRSALHFSWSGVASKYVRIYHALKHGDRTF